MESLQILRTTFSRNSSEYISLLILDEALFTWFCSTVISEFSVRPLQTGCPPIRPSGDGLFTRRGLNWSIKNRSYVDQWHFLVSFWRSWYTSKHYWLRCPCYWCTFWMNYQINNNWLHIIDFNNEFISIFTPCQRGHNNIDFIAAKSIQISACYISNNWEGF